MAWQQALQLIQTKMKLFANDTSLYIEFANANNTSKTLNEDFINIQLGANQWLVKFNSSKQN